VPTPNDAAGAGRSGRRNAGTPPVDGALAGNRPTTVDRTVPVRTDQVAGDAAGMHGPGDHFTIAYLNGPREGVARPASRDGSSGARLDFAIPAAPGLEGANDAGSAANAESRGLRDATPEARNRPDPIFEQGTTLWNGDNVAKINDPVLRAAFHDATQAGVRIIPFPDGFHNAHLSTVSQHAKGF
jgi:hypothetical protein